MGNETGLAEPVSVMSHTFCKKGDNESDRVIKQSRRSHTHSHQSVQLAHLSEHDRCYQDNRIDLEMHV